MEQVPIERNAMDHQVLFIHGAGGYEEDEKLAVDLQDVLGAAYEVQYPQMPNEDNLEYEAWKQQIVTELAALDDEVILLGHSLGGSILLKCLSEEKIDVPIAGLFLIAVPFWNAEGWQVSEYELEENVASNLPSELPMFFYHSRDDEIVPFSHLALYAEKLPQATIRKYDTGGHQFNNDLSDVARDIKRLEKKNS
ncbi:alpha/beta fold hydrolase [Haladaptatus halobius]|uniref:alpha/beta fold hydrolase n=1 Tax=Haladaptatus halobius TaxID=2884875 RepID=UPI001D0B10ED|nr:alpha/beta fold hydrolase [Haladaptatus halobius]